MSTVHALSNTVGSRLVWKTVGASGALIAAMWYTLRTLNQTTIDVEDYFARIDAILRTTALIDGDNDLPYLLR